MPMDAVQVLLQYLSRMQWSDYLDIIVVAFLIYKLLPMIRTPSIMRITRTVLRSMKSTCATPTHFPWPTPS